MTLAYAKRHHVTRKHTSSFAASDNRRSSDSRPVLTWLAVALGASLAFDNVPGLYSLAGLSTGSIAPALILVMLLIVPRTEKSRSRILWRLVLALAAFSAISIVVSLFYYGERTDVLAMNFGGEPIISKSFKTALIVAAWIAAIFLGLRLAEFRPQLLFVIGCALLSVNILGLALELSGLMSSGSSNWSHAVSWHADRPRGFKFESSVFGASLIASVALISVRTSIRKFLLLLAPLLFVLVLLSSSRGALVAVAGGIALALAVLFVLRARGLGTVVAALMVSLLIVFISFLGFTLITNPLWAPLSSGGSDTTRSGWGLVAINSLSLPPLGLNLFNYWFEIQPLVQNVIGSLSTSVSRLDLTEFSRLAFAVTDSGLSPKSMPAMFTVWFGIGGLIFAMVVLVLSIVGAGRRTLDFGSAIAIGVSMNVLALITFVPGIFTYETALVVGVGLAFALRRDATGHASSISRSAE